jgi:cytochrome c oxidase cbb3-type subunit 1
MFFLTGMVLMAFNTWQTVRKNSTAPAADAAAQAA